MVLAILPVALRLALLPHSPAPTPSGADDFAYLLLGDTLRHFRFANPPHALPEFFEQLFVLQRPTLSSIYPIGQGLVLALGSILFGHPWAGVLVSIAALCSLSYWMLIGWTTPGWALAGGVLAVIEFGPLSYWTNSYWGGAVSAIAGCLVFGALPRLRQRYRHSHALALGAGLGLQLITRPYEFLLLVICVALFFLPALRNIEWHRASNPVPLVALPLACAGALMLFHNRQVTGSWTILPYQLYRYQYGVPTTFTFQPNPIPHQSLNREEDLDYRAQSAIHGPDGETGHAYFERLIYRARFYRFFLLAPLYLAFLAFLLMIREFRFLWVLLTLLVFAAGCNFYPYFYPHYIAAITCLFLLASITGLQRLNEFQLRRNLPGPHMATVLLSICVAHFLFWYTVHASASDQTRSALTRFETWDFINYGDPEGRISIYQELERAPGKQLAFVRYGPQHIFHEWVHNAADIDAAHVVWAHDLGSTENQKLLEYYPNRKAWLVEPDAIPPRLSAYVPEPPSFESAP